MRLRGAALLIALTAPLIAGTAPAAHAARDMNDPYYAQAHKTHAAASHAKLAQAESAETDSAATAAAEQPAAGEEGEEKKGGLPQFDPSSFPSQIFWLAITFGLMYTAFSRLSIPAIQETLKRRNAHIEHDIATAQKLRESAETAKARYEMAVAEAQSKSTDMFLKSEAAIKAETAAAIEDFKARAQAKIQKTERDILDAKKDATESIHVIAAEIASLAAEKIVGVSTGIDEAKSVVRNINKKAA